MAILRHISCAIIIFSFQTLPCASHDITEYPIAAPSNGRVFLKLGTALISKPPELILSFEMGKIFNLMHLLKSTCSSIENYLHSHSSLNNSGAYFYWKQQNYHVALSVSNFNILLQDLHTDYNLAPNKNFSTFYASGHFNTIPNSSNEGLINSRTTIWHKTKTFISSFNKLINQSYNLLDYFQNQKLFNATDTFIWDTSTAPETGTAIKSCILKVNSLINEIRNIFITNIYKPASLNSLLYFAFNFYKASFPDIVSHQNSSSTWRKTGHSLINDLLVIKLEFPLKIKNTQTELFLPIKVPLQIEDQLFFVKSHSRIDDHNIVLHQYYTSNSFSTSPLSELSFSQTNFDDQFLLPLLDMHHESTSNNCNLNLLTENIDKSEINCKLMLINQTQVSKLIKLGKHNVYFFISTVPNIIKIQCNHKIKSKILINQGLIKLHNNCTLFDINNMTRTKIDVPDIDLILPPSYIIPFLHIYFTENFVLKFLPEKYHNSYILKRINTYPPNYQTPYEKFREFVLKNQLLFFKINASIFIFTIILLLLFIISTKTPPLKSNPNEQATFQRHSSLSLPSIVNGPIDLPQQSIISPSEAHSILDTAFAEIHGGAQISLPVASHSVAPALLSTFKSQYFLPSLEIIPEENV